MTKLPVPPEVLEQHTLVLGKTRSGKSSKLRVLVEYLLSATTFPPCIIDPKGDWWGLRSSADGKGKGFPVIIFGGPHADIPINAHAGATVAEVVVTGNRPCIIDLKGWMPGDRTRFFVDFASTLFRLTTGQRYLVIDEVHNFAPQGKIPDPEAGKMLHWANRLASEGAGMGVILLSASQRPQKVHKDFVTSNETLIANKVIHKRDRDAVKDWIDGCADPQAGKEVIATLASLQKPEAWVWSPEINFGPKRVTFPLFTTYDSFKPQPVGKSPKGWAAVDLEAVKERIAGLAEEAKANDPKALKAEIARLKADLAKNASPLVPAGAKFDRSSMEALKDREAAYYGGHKDGRAAGYEEGYLAGHRDGFSQGISAVPKRVRSAMGTLERVIADVPSDITAALESIQYIEPKAKRAPKVPVQPLGPASGIVAAKPPEMPESLPDEAIREGRVTKSIADHVAYAGDLVHSKPMQRILDALLIWEHLGHMQPSNAQVAWLAGYSPTSTSYTNPRSALKTRDLVSYPAGDCVSLTDLGRTGACLRDVPAAVLDYVVDRLSTPERRILLAVSAYHPEPVSNEQAAKDAQYSHTSTSYTNPRSSLKTKDLITYPGPGLVRAADWLFEGANA